MKKSHRSTPRKLAVAAPIDRLLIDVRTLIEAARQQVLTALRITSHALNQMNMQLAAHRRDGQDQ